MTEDARLAKQFLDACQARAIMVATAESCTGGGIIAWLTDVPGSSAVVDRGFVTYSNAAKMEMVGVRQSTLDVHGAVSEETAVEMAVGALERSRAGLALAVTGIAGPGGGSLEKPVGLVWIAVATRDAAAAAHRFDFGDQGREAVRRQTARTALELGLATLTIRR